MTGNQLILKWAVFNLAAIGLLRGAYYMGWVAPLFEQDVTNITWAIVALFSAVAILTARRIFLVAADLKTVSYGGQPARFRDDIRGLTTARDRSAGMQAVYTRALSAIAYLHQGAGALAALGLLGTVIGISIATSNISDVANVSALMQTVLGGVHVAINTTIVGVVAALWTEVNTRILETSIYVLLHRLTRSIY